MTRIVLCAVVAVSAALSAVGCGAGGAVSAGRPLAGDDLLQNIAAVVGITPEIVARGDRSGKVRLSVANLETVRGSLSIRVRAPAGATSAPEFINCAEPRVEPASAGAATTDVVCTLPASAGATDGSGARQPEDFQVCGDNGCGARVAQRWYYYAPDSGAH